MRQLTWSIVGRPDWGQPGLVALLDQVTRTVQALTERVDRHIAAEK